MELVNWLVSYFLVLQIWRQTNRRYSQRYPNNTMFCRMLQ